MMGTERVSEAVNGAQSFAERNGADEIAAGGTDKGGAWPAPIDRCALIGPQVRL